MNCPPKEELFFYYEEAYILPLNYEEDNRPINLIQEIPTLISGKIK